MNFYKKHKPTSVLIAGCGRFGSYLASSLSKKGFDVTIIDKDESAFRRLHDEFSGFQICGDASDLDKLCECGIETCDIVLVATDNDNVNCMIAQIANIIFHIDQVYIRLNDTDKEDLLEGTSIKAIYPARLSVAAFEQISNIQLEKVK